MDIDWEAISNKYSGQWVAIMNSEVVASGPTERETSKRATKGGFKDFDLYKINA